MPYDTLHPYGKIVTIMDMTLEERLQFDVDIMGCAYYFIAVNGNKIHINPAHLARIGGHVENPKKL